MCVDLTCPLSALHLLVVRAFLPLLLGTSVIVEDNTWLSSFSNGQPSGESSAHPESPSGPAQNHSDYHEIPLCLPQPVSRLPSEHIGSSFGLGPWKFRYGPVSAHHVLCAGHRYRLYEYIMKEETKAMISLGHIWGEGCKRQTITGMSSSNRCLEEK